MPEEFGLWRVVVGDQVVGAAVRPDPCAVGVIGQRDPFGRGGRIVEQREQPCLALFEHLGSPKVAGDPGAFGGVVDDGAGTPVTLGITVEPMNLIRDTELLDRRGQDRYRVTAEYVHAAMLWELMDLVRG